MQNLGVDSFENPENVRQKLAAILALPEEDDDHQHSRNQPWTPMQA
jgi:hypothetical protein